MACERALWYFWKKNALGTLLPNLLRSCHPSSFLPDPQQFSFPLSCPICLCPLSHLSSLPTTLPWNHCFFYFIFQLGKIWLLYFTLLSSFLAHAIFLWISQKHSSFTLQTFFLTLSFYLFFVSFSLWMFSVCSHKLSMFFMNPEHIYLIDIPGLMSPTSVLHQNQLQIISLLLFLPCFEISCEHKPCCIGQ